MTNLNANARDAIVGSVQPSATPSPNNQDCAAADSQKDRPQHLPEVLLAEDIACTLRVSTSSARRLIRSGACGPWAYMGRRLVVRRDAFLEAIHQREEEQTAQVRARNRGERFRDLLFGKDEAE